MSPAVEQMEDEPRPSDECTSPRSVALPSLDRMYPVAARSLVTFSHQPSEVSPNGCAISSRNTAPYGLPYIFSTNTPSSMYPVLEYANTVPGLDTSVSRAAAARSESPETFAVSGFPVVKSRGRPDV